MNSLFDVAVASELPTPDQRAATAPGSVFKRETEETGAPPRALSETDMKVYLKLISHQYEIFPELKYFPVEPSRVRAFLLHLCEQRLFLLVKRVAVLFPEAMNALFLQQLVSCCVNDVLVLWYLQIYVCVLCHLLQ